MLLNNNNSNSRTTTTSCRHLRDQSTISIRTTALQQPLNSSNSSIWISMDHGSKLLSTGWTSIILQFIITNILSMLIMWCGETLETVLPTHPSVPATSLSRPAPASAQLVPSNCGSSCWSSSATSRRRTSSPGLAVAGSSE